MTPTQPPHALEEIPDDIALLGEAKMLLEDDGDWKERLHEIVIELIAMQSHSSIPLATKPGHCGHEYSVVRDVNGYACAIAKDGTYVIDLNFGTIINERNIEEIVFILNCNNARKQASAEQRIEEQWITAQEEFMFVDDLTGKEVYGVRSEQLKSLLRGERE